MQNTDTLMSIYCALWRAERGKKKEEEWLNRQNKERYGHVEKVGHLANYCKIRHFEQNKAVKSIKQ